MLYRFWLFSYCLCFNIFSFLPTASSCSSLCIVMFSFLRQFFTSSSFAWISFVSYLLVLVLFQLNVMCRCFLHSFLLVLLSIIQLIMCLSFIYLVPWILKRQRCKWLRCVDCPRNILFLEPSFKDIAFYFASLFFIAFIFV